MTDEELEQLIGGYRPTAPAPELRGRVLAGAARLAYVRLEAIDWTFAAAAALLVIVAVGTRTPRSSQTTLEEAARQRAVHDTAEMLGGGAAALSLAELIVPPGQPAAGLERQEQPW
jgi:hypothetical protein